MLRGVIRRRTIPQAVFFAPKYTKGVGNYFGGAALIAIGILLVRSRSLVERFGGVSYRWGAALPIASAVIVTVLVLGIMYSGLATYLG